MFIFFVLNCGAKALPQPFIKKEVPGLLMEETGRKPYNKHQQHEATQPQRATPKTSNSRSDNPTLAKQPQTDDYPRTTQLR
jgi:hypothetical protein